MESVLAAQEAALVTMAMNGGFYVPIDHGKGSQDGLGLVPVV